MGSYTWIIHNTNIKYNLNLDHFKSSILLLLTSVCWLTPNCIEGNFDFVKKELSRTKMLVLQPFRFHLHTNLSLRLTLTLKRISVSHLGDCEETVVSFQIIDNN